MSSFGIAVSQGHACEGTNLKERLRRQSRKMKLSDWHGERENATD